MARVLTPVVPENITVHLGLPDAAAENVRVPFPEYIKNVASSEIYPTWPETALRANILAQISYALNRVYTEYYRSRGYDFDITSTTQYDQKFIRDRDIFENISVIVDGIFNNYVVKDGQVQPYFTQYCNGTTVTCPGLSQWGSVTLAKEGRMPLSILRYYYGSDIRIVTNAPVGETGPSYPGRALRFGAVGEDVRIIQRALNRIAGNYPAIPRIPEINGYYTQDTVDAVRKFQSIFNLSADGVVGKATWYKIRQIYNGIKRLNELYSEGISPQEIETFYPEILREGDSGVLVRQMQYLLAVVAYFDSAVPVPRVDGIFGPETRGALTAFQRQYGLVPDGILGEKSADRLLSVYRDTVANVPANALPENSLLYPGKFLLRGSRGDDVRDLQEMLVRARRADGSVPAVTPDGVFGRETENAVKAVQRASGLDANGIVGPLTWERIAALARRV